MRTKPMSDEQRLCRHVIWCPTSGCLEWTAYRNSLGYGVVGIGSRTDGSRRLVLAHRLSWSVYHGAIPDGLNVLHHCDNPPCINPEHLFLGSHADNNRDMISKGRNVVLRGEQIGTAVLGSTEVRSIKGLFGKLSDCEIARRFGVSYSLIWNIRHGISWRHIHAN